MIDTTDSSEGRLIDGRYRLRGLLGAGGMGEVWRAWDERLDRQVAVKLIRSGIRHRRLGSQAGPYADLRSARFRREAKITANLAGHPNIVTVYDFGEDPLYVVMELVQGTPLDVHVRLEGLPAPADVVAWGVQVCDALAKVHAEKVVHRDLKPSNLILTGARVVKVLDFGVAGLLKSGSVSTAAAQTRLTADGGFIGTVPYAAPEQLRGLRVDLRADLYSLGCLLYELTVGTPPFGTGPEGEVAARHLAEEPSGLRAGKPDVSVDFERLVLDLLAKEPGARPPDALAVRSRLTRLAPPYRARVSDAAGDPLGTAVGGQDRPGGLTLARVFDLHAPDGRPVMGAAHERIASAEERTALLGCLREAPAAVLLPDEPDRVDPGRGRVVPAAFRTDGTWVWSDQIAYYLARYGYAPEPGLRRHFATRQEERPQVTARLRGEAGRLVLAEPEGSLTGRPRAGGGDS
ncbi:serine/threonine-protein kinase [Streptomyces olivochromogenes]|uniref:serine/threonine-protein kinase n=1 Tax=Streptomyces olivochromogenes TaxID=1963 RepID=UPI001F402507|nr:serine/threonine-protein kinase [Streptomyces olivochromogenes]MCF3134405.1 serine/threonine protein kinase [Streptomyces olivochromogenes]